MSGQIADDFSNAVDFQPLRMRLVDFNDVRIRQSPGETVRTSVETGAHDDELSGTVTQRRFKTIVDKTGSGDQEPCRTQDLHIRLKLVERRIKSGDQRMIRKHSPLFGADEALREPVGISNARVRLACAYRSRRRRPD